MTTLLLAAAAAAAAAEAVDSSSGSSYRGMPFSNDYFSHISVMYKRFTKELVDDIEVDMESEEVKEICEAVTLLITKLLNHVEESMPFLKSSDVLRCGSMAEGTRIWKFTDDNEKTVLEFDFLSVLEKTGANDFAADNSCHGFMNITQETAIFPNNYQNLSHEVGAVGRLNANMVSFMFKTELMKAVGKLCSCLKCDIGVLATGDYVFGNITETSEYSEECSECQIHLKTGTLAIATGGNFHPLQWGSSMVFSWKRKVLDGMKYPCEKSRQKPKIDNDVIILVDFLPAIEVTKQGVSPKEHLCYLVPKICKHEHNTCWKISHCRKEVGELVSTNHLHRQCYMVLKFIQDYIDCELKGIPESPKTYMIKSAVIFHIQSCKKEDSSIESCLLEIIDFLTDAFENEFLPHLVLGFNLLDKYQDPALPPEDQLWTGNRNTVMSKCWSFLGHVFRNLDSIVAVGFDFDTIQTILKFITLEYGVCWGKTDFRDLYLPEESYFLELLKKIGRGDFPSKSEVKSVRQKKDKYQKERYQGRNRSLHYMCMLRCRKVRQDLLESDAEFYQGLKTEEEVRDFVEKAQRVPKIDKNTKS